MRERVAQEKSPYLRGGEHRGYIRDLSHHHFPASSFVLKLAETTCPADEANLLVQERFSMRGVGLHR